jgi:hypothetical protein
LAVAVDGTDAAAVVAASVTHINPLPRQLE